MKKEEPPYQTFFRIPVFLLVCASFFTIAITVAAKGSEEVKAWLYANQNNYLCIMAKIFLLLLWIYPTVHILLLLHRNEWQTMLSTLLLIIFLFFLTATFVSFIYYY